MKSEPYENAGAAENYAIYGNFSNEINENSKGAGTIGAFEKLGVFSTPPAPSRGVRA